MSERTRVVVEMPLAKRPTPEEGKDLLKQAFGEAKKLVGPGRVLGIINRAVGVHAITSQPTLILTFAVEAPESVQRLRRTTVAT